MAPNGPCAALVASLATHTWGEPPVTTAPALVTRANPKEFGPGLTGTPGESTDRSVAPSLSEFNVPAEVDPPFLPFPPVQDAATHAAEAARTSPRVKQTGAIRTRVPADPRLCGTHS